MVFIVGVSGSKRKGSATLALVNEMLKACQKHGATTELIDLAQIELPFFDNRESWDYGPEAERIHQLLEKADGFVIGSPEYHGSMSGALKNFFDLLDYERVVAGKPAAFGGVAGGRARAMSVLNHFFVVARALKMWPVPLVVGLNHDDFNEQWHVKDKTIMDRIDLVAKELVKAASVLRK
jgi:FMN reductase